MGVVAGRGGMGRGKEMRKGMRIWLISSKVLVICNVRARYAR